jgi:hypothetical protein
MERETLAERRERAMALQIMGLGGRYFGRGLLQRIAVDHGLLGDRRADRLQERRRS